MVLEVKNLCKSFSDTPVLHNISFTVNKGEIVCIKGRSGEGKTTLLRCMNNLEIPDQGSIKINNQYLCREVNGRIQYPSKKEIQAIRGEIGFVFQNFNLFPHMTVKENITIAPKHHKKMSHPDIYKKAAELLSKLELEGKEDNYPYQLSGGQKQRAAIARACMQSPSVLCFDEPTSALEESTRIQITKIIRDLTALDIAIIIVSHDNAFIEEIAQRVLVLAEGRLYEEN